MGFLNALVTRIRAGTFYDLTYRHDMTPTSDIGENLHQPKNGENSKNRRDGDARL
mgnify:CR=1 FL=1